MCRTNHGYLDGLHLEHLDIVSGRTARRKHSRDIVFVVAFAETTKHVIREVVMNGTTKHVTQSASTAATCHDRHLSFTTRHNDNDNLHLAANRLGPCASVCDWPSMSSDWCLVIARRFTIREVSCDASQLAVLKSYALNCRFIVVYKRFAS